MLRAAGTSLAISECRVYGIIEPQDSNKGGDIMKKVLTLIAAFLIFSSSLAYAAGGKEHGDKGKGSTGDSGKGKVEQKRGG